MEEIYKDDFIILELDKSKKILKSLWLEKSRELTENSLKEEIETISSMIKKYKPLFLLANDKDRSFVYTVEVQKWVAETLSNACVEAQIKKFAIVLPEEIVAQMSTEQTADEVLNLPYDLKMFVDEKEAKKWLEI